MNKSKRISVIADAFTFSVTDSFKNSQPAILIGFGTFEVMDRANPQMGEEIQVKVSKNLSFNTGKIFKGAVN